MRLTGHALAFLARLPAGCKWRLLVRYNQFQRFLPPGHAPYQCPGGILHLDIRESPMMLARALWFYEPRKVGMLQEILRAGMTFVDVGANHGYFTTLGARLVGQSGRVISIEPEPRNSSWILKAVHANHYQNVSIHQVAAGAATGEALLHLGANSGFHSLVGNADGKVITVRRVRLDDIIRRADAIKIDVEGAELQVLQGAQRLLSTSKVVLVEVHPQLGVDCDEVGRFLRDRGFVVELDGADITATHKGMAKGDATSMTA